jgi:hypothetical protein
MRLCADFAVLGTGTGPSAAAYALLRQAGHNPDVEYVPARGRVDGHDCSPRLRPPVLVTDDGVEIATLQEIRRWLVSASGVAAAGIPAQ